MMSKIIFFLFLAGREIERLTESKIHPSRVIRCVGLIFFTSLSLIPISIQISSKIASALVASALVLWKLNTYAHG